MRCQFGSRLTRDMMNNSATTLRKFYENYVKKENMKLTQPKLTRNFNDECSFFWRLKQIELFNNNWPAPKSSHLVKISNVFKRLFT